MMTLLQGISNIGTPCLRSGRPECQRPEPWIVLRPGVFFRGLVAVDGFYFTKIQWKLFLWLGLFLTRDENFRRECSLSG